MDRCQFRIFKEKKNLLFFSVRNQPIILLWVVSTIKHVLSSKSCGLWKWFNDAFHFRIQKKKCFILMLSRKQTSTFTVTVHPGQKSNVVLNSWRGRYRGSAVWTIPFSKSSSARPICEGGRQQQDKLKTLANRKKWQLSKLNRTKCLLLDN